MTDLSIVIATYNREELLQHTLPALAGQRTQDCTYEVLFVDDGASDGTGAVIERAVRERPDLFRYYRLAHSGTPGGPRNHGVRAAAGRVVLLLDDDVIPEPDLVQRHVDHHRTHPDRTEAALGELYLPPEIARDPMSLFHTFPYDEVRRLPELGFLFFWTCNVSVKREFMLEHGMFDEDATLHPLEDMECGWRLSKGGMRLRFLPEARGQHVHKMQPEWVAKKGRRTGRAMSALTRKVPDPWVLERFHLLAPGAPWSHVARQLARRAAGWVVDNPVTLAALRAAGAERTSRNRVSDAYYYLIFRRNVIAGFEEGQREAARGGPTPTPGMAGVDPPQPSGAKVS